MIYLSRQHTKIAIKQELIQIENNYLHIHKFTDFYNVFRIYNVLFPQSLQSSIYILAICRNVFIVWANFDELLLKLFLSAIKDLDCIVKRISSSILFSLHNGHIRLCFSVFGFASLPFWIVKQRSLSRIFCYCAPKFSLLYFYQDRREGGGVAGATAPGPVERGALLYHCMLQ